MLDVVLMRLNLCAVGRLRGGAEAELVIDYTNRFNRIGRNLNLGPLTVREVEGRKSGGPLTEASLLRRILPKGSLICCLDERGTVENSPAFARRMEVWRDAGWSDVSFIIGGADGIDNSLLNDADHLLSFGAMVWPHMLARVMLTEQIYRATSILAGGPYHRA